MKKYRLPLACALVVLLSLALPFAVFSLWDKALLSAPHSQTAAEGLSAEASANPTACTLYACSHVLNVPLGYNSGSEPPWAQTAIDDATLDRARSALRTLHDAGLLTDAQLAKALAVCTQNDKATNWNTATAPGGLTQVSCNVIENFDDESPDSYSSFALSLILTSADTPVYFNYQDGQDTTTLSRTPPTCKSTAPFWGWIPLPIGSTRIGEPPCRISASPPTARPHSSTSPPTAAMASPYLPPA